ncbi:2-hydroxyacid dehydrogenase [Neptunomonas phycophila]|uniref:2-hydroxyacid dehydrogenase n=1 Tax=Neptunomonas phycophila TaxID=1572645 RepID=UPI00094902E7|nr:2-hydroxyacid dehydrogenase [Neptunomonas phycophila]
MKAVFLDAETLRDLDLSGLEKAFSSLTIFDKTTQKDIAPRIQNADVVIVNKVKLDATLLKASQIKLICIVATGTNNVDLEAAKQCGIAVFNCQAYGVPSVVQHAFSLILALHTNLIQYQQSVEAGDWQKSDQFCLLNYPISELAGKSLGVVGYGSLGQGVAQIAKAFGMQVLIARRDESDCRENRLPLAQLLPQVDVLTLHCPLTPATQNLIDEQALNLMKPSAFLVNVARGGIVDEQALANALKSGVIAGAATDVLIEEPPKNGNPLLDSSVPNLIVTPHSAWGSKEARQRIVEQTIENVNVFLSGEQGERRVV